MSKVSNNFQIGEIKELGNILKAAKKEGDGKISIAETLSLLGAN